MVKGIEMNIAFALFAMLNHSVDSQDIVNVRNSERTCISIDGHKFYVFELKNKNIYDVDFQVSKPECNLSKRLYLKIEDRKIKYEGHVIDEEIILQILAKYLFDSGQVDSVEVERVASKYEK